MVDPGFPVGGRRPRRGAWTSLGGHWLPRWLRFKNFVCWNERIWTLSGGGGVRLTPPLDPPMNFQSQNNTRSQLACSVKICHISKQHEVSENFFLIYLVWTDQTFHIMFCSYSNTTNIALKMENTWKIHGNSLKTCFLWPSFAASLKGISPMQRGQFRPNTTKTFGLSWPNTPRQCKGSNWDLFPKSVFIPKEKSLPIDALYRQLHWLPLLKYAISTA